VLPIADRHADYAGKVERELSALGVRTEADGRSESVGKKIRDAELAKVPYMLVVGDKEEDGGAVSVRRHGEGDLGAMTVGEAADRILSEGKLEFAGARA
jgi:threonyl-tRNA synthetase